MHRRVSLQTRRPVLETDITDTSAEEVDGAVSTSTTGQIMMIEQSVAFSATYQVPWFLFSAYDTGGYALTFNHLTPQLRLSSNVAGSPIPLDSLATSSFLRHRSSLPASMLSQTQSIGASPNENHDAPFPLLSQVEHPTLGVPNWSVHPCETSQAMKELLEDEIGESWDDDNLRNGFVKWLAIWFMLLGQIVEMVHL
jgi:ubiquitin-like-conjugating enzyme ATG10